MIRRTATISHRIRFTHFGIFFVNSRNASTIKIIIPAIILESINQVIMLFIHVFLSFF